MAYTEPRTWTDTEFVDDDIMNAAIRDNFRSMGPHLIARRTADQSVTSTTFANDDTLFTPSIPANEIWQFRMLIRASTGAGGLSTSFSIPTSSEMLMTWVGDASVQNFRLIASDGSQFDYIVNNTNGRFYVMDGLFINAGNAGAITHRVKLTTASGTSNVKAQSTLWGMKLA